MVSFAFLLLAIQSIKSSVADDAFFSQQEAQDPVDYVTLVDKVVAKLFDRTLTQLPMEGADTAKTTFVADMDEATLRKVAPPVPRRHMAKVMADIAARNQENRKRRDPYWRYVNPLIER